MSPLQGLQSVKPSSDVKPGGHFAAEKTKQDNLTPKYIKCVSVSLYDTFLFVLKTGFVGSPLKSYKIICQRGVKIIKQTNACCSIST